MAGLCIVRHDRNLSLTNSQNLYGFLYAWSIRHMSHTIFTMQSFFTLNTQDIKFNSHKDFDDSCQLLHF